MQQRRQPHDQAGATSWPRPRSCGPARPCGGGSGPARAASPAARAGTRRTARCRPGTTAPRSGRRPRAASTARRGCARPTRSRAGLADRSTAATSASSGVEAVAGDEAGGPQHAQRVVGERHLGRQRRAQPPGRQVGDTAVGVDELGVGQPQRHGVDGEVAARQVLGDVVGVHDVGLARVLAVGLGAVGGDLEDRVAPAGADRAERLALGPHRVGPPGQQRHRLLGAGVGGEVEVGVGAHPVEHEVAHDPAHQVDRVARVGEPLGERSDVVEHRLQPLGDHRGRLPIVAVRPGTGDARRAEAVRCRSRGCRRSVEARPRRRADRGWPSTTCRSATERSVENMTTASSDATTPHRLPSGSSATAPV